MTGGLAIAARQLTKRYGDVTAVDGFDLAVPVGTVVSLLREEEGEVRVHPGH